MSVGNYNMGKIFILHYKNKNENNVKIGKIWFLNFNFAVTFLDEIQKASELLWLMM